MTLWFILTFPVVCLISFIKTLVLDIYNEMLMSTLLFNYTGNNSLNLFTIRISLFGTRDKRIDHIMCGTSHMFRNSTRNPQCFPNGFLLYYVSTVSVHLNVFSFVYFEQYELEIFILIPLGRMDLYNLLWNFVVWYYGKNIVGRFYK